MDWYRNETWSPEIEQTFQAKLKRCRTQGPQYLYIQALTLAEKKPRITLRLLEQYFSTEDKFRRASAFSVQADAYAKLGLIDEAINFHKQALSWQQKYPYTTSWSRLGVSYLIAQQRKQAHYNFAISVLQSPETTLIFPLDLFVYACSLALIYSDKNNITLSLRYAQQALAAAGMEKSQFSQHARVGLVSEQYAPQVKMMVDLVQRYKESQRV